MSKNILFDGLNLGIKQGTGVATYTRVTAGLARALGHQTAILYSRAKLPPRKPLQGEVIFFDEEPELPVKGAARLALKAMDHLAGLLGTSTREVKLEGAVMTRPLGSRWVPSDRVYAARNIFARAQLQFALFGRVQNIAFNRAPDVAHWTFPLPIRARGGANIYTIHDLVPLRMPYSTLDHKRSYLKLLHKLGQTADHIVTVSEHSRREIIQYLGVDESRVTNTYEAVDIPAVYRDKPAEVLAGELEGLFKLSPQGYFLFFGALEPKKNIARLLQAYLGANVEMPLVMVLSRTWLAESEERFLEKILQEDRERRPGERRRVLRFDYLPFPLLMTLLKGARAVVFPSLYEGFGLPVLEAMTMGTPVITSNVSSIPEVAGDAAMLIDPYDTDALRRAIQVMAADSDLAAGLAERGLKQAGQFSLATYREKLAALYARFG